GLGIIFGAMRVINFAQGDFLMLGMYAAFYLTTGYGVLAFMGPYGGPILPAVFPRPLVFSVGWVGPPLLFSRVAGSGAAASEGAGAYGQILTTLGLSLILQNGALIVFGSTPHGDPDAVVAVVMGDRRGFAQSGSLRELSRRGRGGCGGVPVPWPYTS